jgi:secreted PhoX family phosphatase
MSEISRRRFLEFMGRGFMAAGTASAWLPGCAAPGSRGPAAAALPFKPISPSSKDKFILAEGFDSQVVISWGDTINAKGDRFGFNNDFTAFFPLSERVATEGLLWVNHEYHDPYYTRGWRPGIALSPGHEFTAEERASDRKEVGGSIVHLKKLEGRWRKLTDSQYGARLDANTKIPLISEQAIAGSHTATGTFANCAGGVTPWGTVLTCEENFQDFVGDVKFEKGKRIVEPPEPYLAFHDWKNHPPEHYGWVVEVDPRTARAKKLCAMGRFSHESATCIRAENGRTVVYSGDDCDQEHLYKFIAAKPGSLEKGDLFVADIKAGKWLPLDRRKDKRLAKAFKNHTELLIRTREAAKIVGATPLNRPEDIEIDPNTRAVFIALTMSPKAGDTYGSLLKLEEKDGNPLSVEFKASTFLAGGPETGFSNPDNLVFDRKGNLWMCTDMPPASLLKEPFAKFANNGLFFIPLSGPGAGKALQVASAPRGAELTGPSFSPDGRTLFLSVQHPGEHVHLRPEMQSHWPEGGSSVPKPSVVAIDGPAMDRILA